ncbi:diaminopimelate epimerase [Bacillaceae bacterium JMAK1]|nr:diaminopimelate epimerase [Bacillaceae bacterium JMAK1]
MKFTKLHGLGNSYIYLDGFNDAIPSEQELPQTAIAVSNPYTGIGSDGLILILPSERSDVRMRVFNNDGSEAKNCGNGLRCVSKYVYDRGIVTSTTFTIETLGGEVEAEVHPDDANQVQMVTVDMGVPRLNKSDLPMRGGTGTEQTIDESITIGEQRFSMTGVSMGNPHIIMFTDNISEAPVATLGPIIEKSSVFPEGVNVEWVQMVSEREMHFKVWERGSGITQACGTGACAAVVAAVLNGQSKKDEEVTVHLPGGDLYITWSSKDDHIWMRGEAVTVCHGEYLV